MSPVIPQTDIQEVAQQQANSTAAAQSQTNLDAANPVLGNAPVVVMPPGPVNTNDQTLSGLVAATAPPAPAPVPITATAPMPPVTNVQVTLPMIWAKLLQIEAALAKAFPVIETAENSILSDL
jgi:hypothetical protein